MAKQEPPKKRSRKALPADVKELQQNKGTRKILKSFKDTDLPGAIKKPVHPASFTFMGFHRGSGSRDPVGGQNRGSLTHGGAVKNSTSSVGSPALNKSSQGKNVNEGKPSISSSSGATSLDLKGAVGKSKGLAASNSNTAKGSGQGSTQHVLSSPSGQKKAPAQMSSLQRIPSTKAVASLQSKNNPSGQGSGHQPLNLQSKLVQSSDASGNAATPLSGLRNATNPTRKLPVPQHLEYSSPKSPATPGRLQTNKNQTSGDKLTEAESRVQGRLEKGGVQKSSSEAHQERSAPKEGKKINDMSTGEDESSSDSDPDYAGQNRPVQNQDWKPTRSLIEHVFVTDVTANLVTVTVKESPTSVGFFSIRNY